MPSKLGMLIWLAERPERDTLVLPDGAEAVTVPRDPGNDPDLGRVEVLVPPYRSRRVLDALSDMTSLRLVQALESGVEWLLPHVPEGIPVCNSRGAHDAAVAEWVVGVVLAMQRRLPEHLEAQRRGEWRDVVTRGEWKPPYAGDLEGLTVLIVGFGSIGVAVERRLQPFGVELVRVARGARTGVHAATDLPDLIPQADVVILLAPLTAETEGMIGAAQLSAMKAGGLLINAGRGQLVDQEALTDALHDGHVRAALDVTDPEPLPVDSRLWRAPNLLLTHTWPGTRRGAIAARGSSSASRSSASLRESRWRTSSRGSRLSARRVARCLRGAGSDPAGARRPRDAASKPPPPRSPRLLRSSARFQARPARRDPG